MRCTIDSELLTSDGGKDTLCRFDLGLDAMEKPYSKSSFALASVGAFDPLLFFVER